jgi:hypothetical protein
MHHAVVGELLSVIKGDTLPHLFWESVYESIHCFCYPKGFFATSEEKSESLSAYSLYKRENSSLMILSDNSIPLPVSDYYSLLYLGSSIIDHDTVLDLILCKGCFFSAISILFSFSSEI